MKQLLEQIIAFRNERNWEQFHTGENLAKSISIEAAELLECFQWQHEVEDLEHLKEELADVLIYSLLMVDRYHFDFEAIIKEKLEKNNKKYPAQKAYGNHKKYNKLEGK
ncbi:MAG: nucleotide pyrophosphohydrolase [Bacilli bacterium]|jgi:NTP pyrophosphatase (non-canonical NTP hydrolase)|nr:nucleotide pyrophosphohydrolase [Bacilli bacterium]